MNDQNDQDVRELIRIRWELRQLVTEGGTREVAAPLIDRMHELAAREPSGGTLGGEAGRWRARFRLDSTL